MLSVIKNMLKSLFSIKSWVISITDYINTYINIGADNIDTFSMINEDKKLSRKMTNLFDNCKIHVIIYNSKNPNAYTIPSDSKFFTNALLYKGIKVLNILSLGNLTTLYLLMTILGVSEKNEKYQLTSKNVKFNPDTGKITMPIHNATIYMASSLLDLLDNNEDEIIAMLLHETGHNLQMNDYLINLAVNIGTNYASNYIKFGSLIGLVVWAFQYLSGSIIIENELNIPGKLDSEIEKSLKSTNPPADYTTRISVISDILVKLTAKFILLTVLASFITTYIRRKNEIQADEFAIKCGYGDALYRSIKKLNDYALMRDFGTGIGKIKGFNPFDFFMYALKIIPAWITQLLAIFKVFNYPDPWTRERYIKEKTATYDTSANNINRTADIDQRWFK